jgi:hypothetical protein
MDELKEVSSMQRKRLLVEIEGCPSRTPLSPDGHWPDGVGDDADNVAKPNAPKSSAVVLDSRLDLPRTQEDALYLLLEGLIDLKIAKSALSIIERRAQASNRDLEERIHNLELLYEKGRGRR